MSQNDSTDVPKIELDGAVLEDAVQYARRWNLPSFLVRNYQFGYERECHDLLFAGESRKGAREIEDAEDIILDLQD